MTAVRVCRVADVPTPGAARFEVGGRMVAVVGIGNDDFRAIDAECSHQHAWLDEGDVDVDARTIECPKHGSAFDLDSGAPRSLPAIQPVRVFPVRVNDDEIWIEV